MSKYFTKRNLITAGAIWLVLLFVGIMASNALAEAMIWVLLVVAAFGVGCFLKWAFGRTTTR
jgi:hypothetical protein